jgi:hypothetical protein
VVRPGSLSPENAGFADRVMIPLCILDVACLKEGRVRTFVCKKTGGTMRLIVIPALVGILLLLPSVTFAETFAECQTRCANESASRAASCPRPSFGTDQDRTQCLQAGQDAFNGCITSCQQPAPSDLPADTSADTPKETPAGKPTEN